MTEGECIEISISDLHEKISQKIPGSVISLFTLTDSLY